MINKVLSIRHGLLRTSNHNDSPLITLFKITIITLKFLKQHFLFSLISNKQQNLIEEDYYYSFGTLKFCFLLSFQSNVEQHDTIDNKRYY